MQQLHTAMKYITWPLHFIGFSIKLISFVAMETSKKVRRRSCCIFVFSLILMCPFLYEIQMNMASCATFCSIKGPLWRYTFTLGTKSIWDKRLLLTLMANVCTKHTLIQILCKQNKTHFKKRRSINKTYFPPELITLGWMARWHQQ